MKKYRVHYNTQIVKKQPRMFQNFYCGGPADEGGMVKKHYNEIEKWALAKIYGLFMGRHSRKRVMQMRDTMRKNQKQLHQKTDVNAILAKIQVMNAFGMISGLGKGSPVEPEKKLRCKEKRELKQ